MNNSKERRTQSKDSRLLSNTADVDTKDVMLTVPAKPIIRAKSDSTKQESHIHEAINKSKLKANIKDLSQTETTDKTTNYDQKIAKSGILPQKLSHDDETKDIFHPKEEEEYKIDSEGNKHIGNDKNGKPIIIKGKNGVKTISANPLNISAQYRYKYSDLRSAIKSQDKGGFNPIDDGNLQEYLSKGTLKNETLNGDTLTKQQKGYLREASSSFPIIVINDDGSIVSQMSDVNSGYDENFKTEKAGYFAKVDEDKHLKTAGVNFKKGHGYLRGRTHEIVHINTWAKGTSKSSKYMETTGHTGALFNDINSTISRQRTQGSNGNESFHQGRQKKIEEVINNLGVRDREKPIIASIEALKYKVGNTIRYNNINGKDENGNSFTFKGYTTSGLNLEDPQQKELALKHYQAVRDKDKLLILALEDKTLNNKDITSGYLNNVTSTNQRLHASNLSPIRYSSPYSRANLDRVNDKLKSTNTYEDICKVGSEATPCLITRKILNSLPKNRSEKKSR